MRRMFSEKQLKEMSSAVAQEEISSALEGDISIGGDLSVSGESSLGDDVSITGDLSVSGAINGVENPSVKPIYIHPITLEGESSDEMRLTMLIFNNDATPFTKSSFIQWLDDLYTQVGATTRVMISGGLLSSGKVLIGSYMGKTGTNTYYVIGINCANGENIYRGFNPTEFSAWINAVSDGVNKIN